MRVQKKELLRALEQVSKFTSDNFACTKKVLVDGPGQRVVATDLSVWAEHPVEIYDYIQQVKGQKPVVEPIVLEKPGEDFEKALKALKAPQLTAICADLEIDGGKNNASRVEAIVKAAEEFRREQQAELDEYVAAENAKPAPVTEVYEAFMCDPALLMKVLSAEDTKPADQVTLTVQEFTNPEGEFGLRAAALSVGEYFQSIPLQGAEDFADTPVFSGSPCGKLKAADLVNVLGARGKDNPWQMVAYFDPGAGRVVAGCSGRLHMMDAVINAGGPFAVDAKPLQALAKTVFRDSKDAEIEMEISGGGRKVRFRYGQLTVTARCADSQYPDYQSVLQAFDVPEAHTVEIEQETLLKVIDQVKAVLHKFVGCRLTMNGGLNAAASAGARNDEGFRGEYERFNVPFKTGKIEPEMTVGINVDYLRQAVAASGKTVQAKVLDPDRPLLFSGGKFSAVVMPMRL